MSKNINEEIFELMLTGAAKKYAENVANKPVDEVSDETRKYIEESRQRTYNNVMKQVKRAEKQEKRRSRMSIKRLWYIAAVFVVLAALIIPNATAIPSLVYRTYSYIEGNVLKVKTDYSQFDRQYSQIQNFCYKDDLIIPTWMPNRTQLEIKENFEDQIVLKYTTQNRTLKFYEINVEVFEHNLDFGIENNSYKEQNIEILGMEGEIYSMKQESGINMLTAIWRSDNVQYMIVTNYSEVELMAVLEKLDYYRNIK